MKIADDKRITMSQTCDICQLLGAPYELMAKIAFARGIRDGTIC
jgi:hypothetical protein